MRIALITPARRFIANANGLGYQVPLGLVFVAGPLVDAGHTVRLIDNDAYGWSLDRLEHELRLFRPDCIMLGHTGSTAAHPICLSTAAALRLAFPSAPIVYGGVYPSYAWRQTLESCSAIDVIVRGEAEPTIVELVAALVQGIALSTVPGIAYRREDGSGPVANPGRPAAKDLDVFRPAWELVDWPLYSLYGMGRSAGMQLSRGCPLTCTYCGQWMFWKKWRHRSPANVVKELTTLRREYGVTAVWFADESFSADRDVARELLERIADANLGQSLNINMTAQSVVRDADLMPLYKRAGVDYVVMGIESLEDSVVERVRKNNPFALSVEAVRVLRQNDILSLTNLIYGLETETPETLREKRRALKVLDSDILNACYLTPHFWTQDGRKTTADSVIEEDLSKWTYRNQVISTPSLSPWQLFWGVKVTEALHHLRPRALWRLLFTREERLRVILRQSMVLGVTVVFAEVLEFLRGWPKLTRRWRRVSVVATGERVKV